MSNERTCIQCKKKLPENTDNFHRSKDGFHARCKVCRRKHERERREKEHQQRDELLRRGRVKAEHLE